MFDGKTVLTNGALEDIQSALECAEIVIRKLVSLESNGHLSREGESKYRVVISLDHSWPLDSDFGPKILRALMARPEILIERVVVFSLYTESILKSQYNEEFGIDPSFVVSKHETSKEGLYRLLFEAFDPCGPFSYQTAGRHWQ